MSVSSSLRSKPWSRQVVLAAPFLVLISASAAAYAGWIPGAAFRAPWDKAMHFLIFGAVAAALPNWLPARLAPLALWAPLALAGADEWAQQFSPRRSSDAWDFAADTAGIFAAYAVTTMMGWRRNH